jgi:hypothetical protein
MNPSQVGKSLASVFNMNTRYEYYETDDRVTISIFDRGADPAQIAVKFDARKVCVVLFDLMRHSCRFSFPTRMGTRNW